MRTMQTRPNPRTRAARQRVHAYLIGLGTAAMLLVGCVPPGPTTSTTPIVGAVNHHDRQSVATAYRDRLVPKLAVTNSWNGDVAGCRAGTVDPVHQQATLDTINWFRGFVGLSPVTFDPVYDAKAQKAALMMQAKGQLSHYPDPAWSCYSTEGAEAAGRSNLYLGISSGPAAIAGYISDPGPNNTAVGHRRWILDPTRLTMGSGTTSRANALWVLGESRPLPTNPAVVAWPAAGFFPVQLEPAGRWSLSIPKADFSGSTVAVRDDRGISYGVTVHPVVPNRGQNTLVWQVSGLDTSPTVGDRSYTVSVGGIRNWVHASYTYSVTIFDPLRG